MLEFAFPPNLDHGFNNCEDAMISSVVYNEADRYECLHTLFWGMEYFPPTPERPSLNDRFYISGLFRLRNSYLRDLFGLEFEEHKGVPQEEFLDNLRRRLFCDKRAVVLRMDTFDCPWNVGYQNYHRRHFVIVTDYTDQGELVCHDPFCKVSKGVLPLDAITGDGYDYYNYTVDASRCKGYSVTWLLHTMASSYLEQVYAGNVRRLADELRNYNLYDEVKDIPFDSICLAPFFIQLKGIVSSRLNLIDFVHILPDRMGEAILPRLSNLAESWNVAYCVLIKAMSRAGAKEYMEQVSDLLERIADEEEALAKQMVALGEDEHD